jgi:hypothetical protein
MTAPFDFRQFGTFTGPQSSGGSYNYDALSTEGSWQTTLPTDLSFKLNDLAAVLFNVPGDYVGFYCNGVSTQMMTLAHSTGRIPTLNVEAITTIFNGDALINGDIVANGTITANGSITSNGTITANGTLSLTGVGDVATNINLAKALPAKPFDISHPSKEGYRLRHVSLEGPEIGVYYRGKLENKNIITLPDYWDNLIDLETITVNLTPVGFYQELFVEKIEWGKKVIIKNREGGPIKCHYTIFAERKDMDKLIVEYEGTSVKDYPGQDWLNLKGV